MITFEKKATYNYDIQEYKIYLNCTNKDYLPKRIDSIKLMDSIRLTL